MHHADKIRYKYITGIYVGATACYENLWNSGNSSAQVFAFTAKAVRTYKGWEESGLFAEGKLGIGRIP